MRKLMSVLRQIPAVSRPRTARREADELRFKLVNAEAAAERMRQQRDHCDRENNDLRKQVAEMAAENVIQADRIRSLEASLSDAREQLRRERVARARDAEGLTPGALSEAMTELQRRIPGQRDGEVGA